MRARRTGVIHKNGGWKAAKPGSGDAKWPTGKAFGRVCPGGEKNTSTKRQGGHFGVASAVPAAGSPSSPNWARGPAPGEPQKRWCHTAPNGQSHGNLPPPRSMSARFPEESGTFPAKHRFRPLEKHERCRGEARHQPLTVDLRGARQRIRRAPAGAMKKPTANRRFSEWAGGRRRGRWRRSVQISCG